MRTYSFSKNNSEFISELRKEVKTYFSENNKHQYGNYESWIKALFMALLYFIPFIVMIFGNINSGPLVIILWFAMGIGMAGVGMAAMHDANHGSFSKHKWINNLMGNTLYLLGGFPPNWRFQHNTLHHGYTNIDGQDEDIGHESFLRFSPNQQLKKIHRYQYIYAWFFYGLMTISWITVKDFIKLIRYKRMGAVLSSSGKYDHLLVDLVISKVLYFGIFLLLPLLVVAVSWYWILAGFILMHFTSGLILSTIFQTAHVMPTSEYPLPDDNGRMENNWAIHQLLTTTDFAPKSKVFSWLIGGLNYQVIHHLFPNVSHIHYKRLSSIVQSTALKYGLPYYVNRNFLVAINEHGKMLKLLGCKTTEKVSGGSPVQM